MACFFGCKWCNPPLGHLIHYATKRLIREGTCTACICCLACAKTPSIKYQCRPQACLSGVLARSYATHVVSCRGGSNRVWRGNWLYSSPGPWHPPLALIIYKLLLNQGAPGPAYEEKLHLYVLHIWLQQTRHSKLKFLKLFAWLFDINNLISYEFWRHFTRELTDNNFRRSGYIFNKNVLLGVCL